MDPLVDETDNHPVSVAAKGLMYAVPYASQFCQPFLLLFLCRIRSVQLALMLPTRVLLPTLSKIGSANFRRFVVDMVPWKNVRRLRDISDTLHHIAVEIYETKKRAIEGGDDAVARQIGGGKDIMSILSEHDRNFYGTIF